MDINSILAAVGILLTAIILIVLGNAEKKVGVDSVTKGLQLAKVIVQFGQQMAKVYGWSNERLKKNAMATFRSINERLGLELTDKEMDLMIEAMVYEVKKLETVIDNKYFGIEVSGDVTTDIAEEIEKVLRAKEVE